MASCWESGSNRQAAVPAGRHIVRVTLETDGVVDDFGCIPTEVSEGRGERDRGQSYRRRGTTSHTHWNTVTHAYVERHSCLCSAARTDL